MVVSIKQRFVEILGVFATVLGSLYMNGVALELTGDQPYKGFELLYLDLFIFSAWYIVASLLILAVHPKPSKFILLLIGFLAAIILVISTKSWTEPSIGLFSKMVVWLISHAKYLIVVPLFFLVGVVAERFVHAQTNDT